MKKKIPVNENKTINLPSDYVEFKKVGFIMKDGRVEVNYNPDLKKDTIWHLAIRAIKDLR